MSWRRQNFDVWDFSLVSNASRDIIYIYIYGTYIYVCFDVIVEQENVDKKVLYQYTISQKAEKW